MLYFLYGPDTYRSRQKLNEILETYKKIHKSGLNLKMLDAKSASWRIDFKDFKRDIEALAMFKEKRMIVIEDVLSNRDFKEKLEAYLQKSDLINDRDTITIIYERDKVSGLDFLIKKAKSQEFKLLEGFQLRKWVFREAEKLNLKLPTDIARKLISYIGNDLWRMSHELQKLAHFKKRGEVTVDDIDLMVRPQITLNIFNTIDALALKDRNQALKLISRHLNEGESELYLLSMISYQFRNLIKIKAQSESASFIHMHNLSKELGMHPYVVKKTMAQAKYFNLEELKRAYKRLLEADFNIKTGQINPRTALIMLVAQI